jgi:hypothetical protein
MENKEQMLNLEKQITNYVEDIFMPRFMNYKYNKRKHLNGTTIIGLNFMFEKQRKLLIFAFLYEGNNINIEAYFKKISTLKNIFEIKGKENIEEIFKHINAVMKKEKLKDLYEGD